MTSVPASSRHGLSALGLLTTRRRTDRGDRFCRRLTTIRSSRAVDGREVW